MNNFDLRKGRAKIPTILALFSCQRLLFLLLKSYREKIFFLYMFYISSHIRWCYNVTVFK